MISDSTSPENSGAVLAASAAVIFCKMSSGDGVIEKVRLGWVCLYSAMISSYTLICWGSSSPVKKRMAVGAPEAAAFGAAAWGAAVGCAAPAAAVGFAPSLLGAAAGAAAWPPQAASTAPEATTVLPHKNERRVKRRCDDAIARLPH